MCVRTEEDERDEERGWHPRAEGREEGGEDRGSGEREEKVPVNAVFRDVFLVGHPRLLAFEDLKSEDGQTYRVVDALDHDDADHAERDDGQTLFDRSPEGRRARWVGGCEALGEDKGADADVHLSRDQPRHSKGWSDSTTYKTRPVIFRLCKRARKERKVDGEDGDDGHAHHVSTPCRQECTMPRCGCRITRR